LTLLSLPLDLLLNGRRIAKIDEMRQAHIICASRYESLIYPVITEIAFERRPSRIIETNCAVGARFDTGLTSRALVTVEDDNSVFSLSDGLLGARVNARRIVAVAAHGWTMKVFKRIADDLWAVIMHVYELDFVIVFLFARDFTGLASPTRFVFYFQRILVHWPGLSQIFSG